LGTVVSTTKKQIEMDFTPGLTDQFPDLMDVVAAAVYGSRIGLGGVAAHLDKSPSLLSRMLNKNPDDLRHLPLADLTGIVQATGDLRPIYWLIEKFCEDNDAKRKRTMDEIVTLLPKLAQLVKAAQK